MNNKKLRYQGISLISSQVYLSMKLYVVIFFASIMTCLGSAHAQRISLDQREVQLKKILVEISRQSGYTFIYDEKDLATIKPVTIQVNNKEVVEILDLLFKGQPLQYQIKGRSIAITPLVKSPISVLQKTIRGRVTDPNGVALEGATVLEKGTNNGATTNADGNFSITLRSTNPVLTIGLIGYESKEITVDNKTELSITLTTKTKELQEVVVTALGIQREQKALGYSTTVVKGETLTEARSNNWLDALSGKVPGLNLVRSNAGPGGSSKVILRGENNLTGDNEALIVVDGVIINHGSARRTASSAIDGGETAVDWGTSLNDINPDDIETVTVLKGPGASALYGGRGGNGAIIITTKQGKPKAKGLGISINSNFSYEQINRQPSLQYEYGQGEDGADYYSFNSSVDGPNTANATKAFGPKFEGQQFYQYDPITHTQGTQRTLWRPYKDEGFIAFFEPATTYTNSVAIDGGTDKTSARFSYTNVNNKWIVPNTGYNRNTVAISVSSKPNKNLQITTQVNYTNKKSDNLPSAGYGQQSIMYGFVFWQPSAPISWLRDYWMPGQTNITQSRPFSNGVDNPYAIAYEYLNKMNRNSVTGNISATYTINSDLTLTARTAMDMGYDQRSQQRSMDAQGYRKGLYRTQGIFSQEMNSDFMLKYKKDFKDINLTASLGGSMLRNNYKRDEVRADSLIYPGIFTTANSAGVLVSVPYRSTYAINSLYGLVTAGYKDKLFVDFTLRNDWTSMLATPQSSDNVSILYPSVNASLILSEVFKLPKPINYAKLRASVAGVGNGGNQPYKTSINYSASGIYPGGGLFNPTTLSNPSLQPLFTTSYETGIEAKFFKSRLGFDVTLYLGNTKDQILTSTVDAASGMENVIVNAGMVQNKGIEIALNGTPLRSNKGLTWDMNLQFTANRNKVMELVQGMKDLTLQNGPGSNGYIIAKVGGSMGDLYGRGYLRAPDGQIVYESGLPKISDSLLYLGNTMPKWKASISNSFKYKNFRLNILIDGQYGSVAYSLTQGKMAVQGKSTETLVGRYNGIVGTGVVSNGDGTYSPNTVIVENLANYYDVHFGVNNVEGSTFPTDFIKLRECRLDYTFKAKLLKRVGMQKASIGVYGRDLFILSRWPGFDPEFGTLSGTEINRGFEAGQFPSTRTYGVNLSVAF